MLAPWYGDLKAWLVKRKRVLLITAGVCSAGVVAYYGVSRYRNASREAPRVGPRSEEEGALQLRQHFEAIQVIADTTTLPSSLQHFRSRLAEAINLSELTQRLMAGKEGPQAMSHAEKMNLWQKLKLSSFTRAVCAGWGMGLVHLFVRVQLNLLGKYMYISTAKDTSSPLLLRDLPLSAQHKFLAFADYLPCYGIQQLVQDIEEAVEAVLTDVSLRNPYTFDELKALFERITGKKDHIGWISYLLPEGDKLPEDLEEAASSSSETARLSFPEMEGESSSSNAMTYEELVSQMRMVLVSDEFLSVLALTLDAIRDLMLQDLLLHYQGQPDVAVPLAKLVPAVSSLSSQMLENLDNNKYICAVSSLPQVDAFCALVYGA